MRSDKRARRCADKYDKPMIGTDPIGSMFT
jgi:hypothetical protein